jgi:iron complex outermembrane receptor protein
MKYLFTTLGAIVVTSLGVAQEQKQDTVKTVKLDEVLVSSVRVTSESPVTFSNLSKTQLKKRNLGQDIPFLMNFLPSVVTTSDAGAGVGYTGIRVRGSDATRVNVTINGIPYNDAESHGTFWVNMPDFASSTENLQLQRGVGTSTNGSGAFGASLNILTDAVSDNAFGEISSSIGSFSTNKNTVKFSTGKLNNHFEISGRLSNIKSDGYIDRASSDLDSYFLQGAYVDDNTLIKALLFGGHEITYQSWNGIDEFTLASDRTFNSAGAIYDDGGNVIDYYDNEVDNYKQDHAQLHWNEQWTNNWSTNIALHFTYGRGYFEQYKQDEDFADYGLTPITMGTETVNTTDLIRRRWLDNNFYGTTFSANYKKENLDVIVGGAYNKYEGDHFGEIIWARYTSDSEIRDRYYEDNSTKTDFNTFAKAIYKLNGNWSLFGDLQYRNVTYKANGDDTGLVDDSFNFFNPKAGITYIINPNNKLYFSYARANREPNRNDYENGSPKPEKLNDFELGWRYSTPTTKINTNVYYMGYKDQLVLTGELNDVGAPLRKNVGDSYRLGLEVDATILVGDKLVLRPNVALSTNKNVDFYSTDSNGDLVKHGDTDIAFSPSIIAGNILTVEAVDNLYLSLLSKYVGKQFMGNIELEASELDDYFVNDLNLQYEINTNSFVKSITLTGLLNNIFNTKYSSNGYMWDVYPYYYPQAGTNFLVGATLRF